MPTQGVLHLAELTGGSFFWLANNEIAQRLAEPLAGRVDFRAKQHGFEPCFAVGLLTEEQQLTELMRNLLARDFFAGMECRPIENRKSGPRGRFVLFGPGTRIQRQAIEVPIG